MKRQSCILLIILFSSNFLIGQFSKEQYFEYGKKAYENGFLITAVENFTKVIESDSLHSDAYYYRAKTYIKGEFTDSSPRAIRDYMKCIAIDSLKNYWEAYFYIARNLYTRNAKYISFFDKALSFQVNDIEIIISRGFANQWWGKNEEAIKDFNLALTINPKNIRALISRGTSLINIDVELALKDLRKARKLDKDNPRIYYAIGDALVVYNQLGHKKNYCKYYKKASKLGYRSYNISMKNCGIKHKE